MRPAVEGHVPVRIRGILLTEPHADAGWRPHPAGRRPIVESLTAQHYAPLAFVSKSFVFSAASTTERSTIYKLRPPEKHNSPDTHILLVPNTIKHSRPTYVKNPSV